MGQYWTMAGLIAILQRAFSALTTVNVQGVTTNGSPNVTNLSTTTGLAVGQTIVGVGVPSGTTILSINTGASSLVMSANATATSTTSAETQFWAFGILGMTLGLTVHLLTGGIPQSSLSIWSQLTEATYDGYAPQACAYPFIESTPDQHNVSSSCQCMTFTPTDYLVPNTITGIAWTFTVPGASAPTLVAVEQFATPTTLSIPGDLIRVIPVLALPTNVLGLIPSPVLE